MDFYCILGSLGREDQLRKITFNHNNGTVFMANLQDSLILGIET